MSALAQTTTVIKKPDPADVALLADLFDLPATMRETIQQGLGTPYALAKLRLIENFRVRAEARGHRFARGEA